MGVTVTSDIIQKTNKEIGRIKGRTLSGVLKAGLYVKGESLKVVPWRTGNLAGSAYTEARETIVGPVCEIGYTASYAPFVHEIKRVHYTKAGTSWKYLEIPLNSSQKIILDIIRSEVKI